MAISKKFLRNDDNSNGQWSKKSRAHSLVPHKHDSKAVIWTNFEVATVIGQKEHMDNCR
ncbi:hypothetical protein T4A_6153 [Trichinella pseudospiralis]|uniref:Uncharacterized protein n=1 Tax=Trichinella pseudospiralis TaxID=6337 RepID=A0A0V1JLH2_TRIPS|nr:hypothetical protein T4A_6153 [Trichinella pseudospiralis]KRY81403.1 hypothetical protein T4D_8454 [Trichinella pseudospiralis]KRZ35841.1 hypothetical protein T4C_3526 [Trichinella pseudospiralis]